MSAVACQTTSPHAHTYVAGPDWIEAILRQLRTGNSRVTQPRIAVLQWIAAQDAPFTAEEAVAALETTIPAGSRATIYRFLLWLREAGWLSRVHRNDRDHGLVRQLPGHHQAICLVCGDTLTIGGCDLSSLIGESLVGTGFAISGHSLEIFGTCQKCNGP